MTWRTLRPLGPAILLFATLGGVCDGDIGGFALTSRDEAADRFYLFLCEPFAFARCDCVAPRWPGPLERCEPEADGLADDWQRRADDRKLDYDAACLARLVQATSGVKDFATQCGDGSLVTCEQECQIFFGERELGESCDAIGRRISTCQQDLACGPDGLCHEFCDVPTVATEGQFCGHELGLFAVRCADGLACVGNRCVGGVQPGEPCEDERPCADSSYCGDGTCSTKLAAGESCSADFACLSGVCEDQRCFDDQPVACVGFHW